MSAGFSLEPLSRGSAGARGPYVNPSKAIARVNSRDRFNGSLVYVNEHGGVPEMNCPPESAEFVILPTLDPAARDVWSISGASGSGKSFMAKAIAEEYKDRWPKRKVYVISALHSDKTLDSMRDRDGKEFLLRLSVESFVEDPLEAHEVIEGFRHSLVILDDCEALEQDQRRSVQEVLKALLTLGRHSVTSVIVCQHQPARGKETSLQMSESTMFIMFPQGLGAQALSYLLETHIGMSAKEARDLKKIPSRWVAIARSFPRYIVSRNTIKLLP